MLQPGLPAARDRLTQGFLAGVPSAGRLSGCLVFVPDLGRRFAPMIELDIRRMIVLVGDLLRQIFGLGGVRPADGDGSKLLVHAALDAAGTFRRFRVPLLRRQRHRELVEAFLATVGSNYRDDRLPCS